jgi:hypothetical protein
MVESLSPNGMPLLGWAKSGMPRFSFFPRRNLTKFPGAQEVVNEAGRGSVILCFCVGVVWAELSSSSI